jgi:hypothetical protein
LAFGRIAYGVFSYFCCLAAKPVRTLQRMGHIALPGRMKPATANNNMGGGALDEDQNHDTVACCLGGNATHFAFLVQRIKNQ